MRIHHLWPLLLLCTVSACDAMPDWFGEEEPPPLPGERFTVVSPARPLEATSAVEDVEIILPDLPDNTAWPQALGNATGVVGNMRFTEGPEVDDSANVGDGEEFIGPVIPAPIVAEGMVFAVDGAGHISAHKTTSLDTVRWMSDALVEQDEEEEAALTGGGLAYGKGSVFAVNDEGVVVALTAKDGSLRWKKELKLPVRSAPRFDNNMLYILTADNQLMAISIINGDLKWSHQGVNEVSTLLQANVPAVRDGIVVAPYSSGEFAALDAKNGSPLWRDTLQNVRPLAEGTSLTGSVSPLMAQGLTIASAGGLMAGLDTERGRRVWDREINTANAPWLSGNTLFVLTQENQLAAIRGVDGAVHWVKNLPLRTGGDSGDRIVWSGPLVAQGRVWVLGNHGEMLSLEPQNGGDERVVDIPSGRHSAPVLADKVLYLLGEDATLTALK